MDILNRLIWLGVKTLIVSGRAPQRAEVGGLQGPVKILLMLLLVLKGYLFPIENEI